ncbi:MULTISPECIES: hypothetical protein [Candidatus Cardinium]|uniref:hypothetical protein n=1 Tax=Candidatus Cardinium TaxID=273135 RepID=UPI001FA9F750|nr:MULTISPECIES: hypothetical protein [Cardinium]
MVWSKVLEAWNSGQEIHGREEEVFGNDSKSLEIFRKTKQDIPWRLQKNISFPSAILANAILKTPDYSELHRVLDRFMQCAKPNDHHLDYQMVYLKQLFVYYFNEIDKDFYSFFTDHKDNRLHRDLYCNRGGINIFKLVLSSGSQNIIDSFLDFSPNEINRQIENRQIKGCKIADKTIKKYNIDLMKYLIDHDNGNNISYLLNYIERLGENKEELLSYANDPSCMLFARLLRDYLDYIFTVIDFKVEGIQKLKYEGALKELLKILIDKNITITPIQNIDSIRNIDLRSAFTVVNNRYVYFKNKDLIDQNNLHELIVMLFRHPLIKNLSDIDNIIGEYNGETLSALVSDFGSEKTIQLLHSKKTIVDLI